VGTITSGIGLLSGLDINGIVDQLVSIEARPRDLIVQRMGTIDAQRTAFSAISAQISAILNRITALAKPSFFDATSISSSNADALGASASGNVAPGSYDFVVRQLAASHQFISRGYQSADAQLSPGSFLIESSRARLNTATALGELNGFAGVQRGSFSIEDASGAEAVINVNDSETLNDVIAAINDSGLNVSARVRNDRIELTETTGGALRVRDVNGGRTAADLGFGPGRTSSTTGQITGDVLMKLGGETPLAALNDGNGVSRARAGGDFTILGAAAGPITVDLSEILTSDVRVERLNHGNGVNLGRIRVTTLDAADQEVTQEIDLSGATTAGEIKDAIEGSLEGVSVNFVDNRFVIAATGAAAGKTLRIEDLSGTGARDLGIDGTAAGGTANGRAVLRVDSVRDVLAAINFASGNDGSVSAALDGGRISISGASELSFAEIGGSTALRDLGFDATSSGTQIGGRRLIGGVNTVRLQTLNGGQGVQGGSIRIQTATADVTLDLSAAETLGQVINLINDASGAESLGIEAGYDASGTRLVLSSRDGSSSFTVSDVGGGTTAQSLGIAGSGVRIRGENLQRQYVSDAATLDSLNNGRGVQLGQIQITNSNGLSRTVDLNRTSVTTVHDVIARINDALGADFGVTARINDTGDGLALVDTNAGEFALRVDEVGANTARDLNILGESSGGTINGSFELNLDISGGETLQDLVRRINDSGGAVRASLINDGSGVSPYRLQLSAADTGLAGEFLADGAALGLDLTLLSRAQDAKVVIGSDASTGVTVTSSTNTISDVVPGLSIDLGEVTSGPVTVTVDRNTDAIVEQLSGFVDDYNAAVSAIGDLTKFDSATETRGLLMGDGTLRLIERRLSRLVSGSVAGATGTLQRLSQVGISLSDGSVSFDEQKFRDALQNDFAGVTSFFSDSEVGAAEQMKQALKQITDSDGLISRRGDALEKQSQALSDRVDQLNARLDRSRERLTRQFQAMERALAGLQSQQAAIGQLGGLAGSPFGSASTGSSG